MDPLTPASRPARASKLLDSSLSSSSLSLSALRTPTGSTSEYSFFPSTARKRPLDTSTSTSTSTSAEPAARRARLQESFESRAQSRELYEARRRAEEAEARAEELRVRVERLERDREWLDEREREVRERAEREAKEREEGRAREEGEIRRLRLDAGEARIRLDEIGEELARVKRRREEELEQSRRKEERLARNVLTAEELVQSASRRAEMAQNEAAELRLKLDEMEDELARRSRAALGEGGERDDQGDMAMLAVELGRETLRADTALVEVERWKREAEGARARVQEGARALERCRDLERKLVQAGEVGKELAKAKEQLEERRREWARWERILQHPEEASTAPPSALTTLLSALHAQQTTLSSQLATLSSQAASLRSQLAAAEARAGEAELAVDAGREGAEEARAGEARERRMREVLDREVGSLRALLATYAVEAQQSSSPGQTVNVAQQEHVKALEQQLDAVKAESGRLLKELAGRPARQAEEGGKELTKLREDLERLERELNAERVGKEEVQAELTAAHAALEQAEELKDGLEQRLFDLGEKIGQGLHVPPGEKVLQMTSNPVSDHFAVRAEQLDALRAERDALLSKQKSEGWVPSESWAAVQREKESLLDEAKQREKRMLRLKQVFAAKATEFREAVTSILGYKLNFSGNGRVRLTSIYDPGTALVFQSSDDESNTGSMRLIGVGERAEQGEMAEGEGISGALEFWVRQRGSIPCFLSQLTIECFEKTPTGRSAGYAETE
ncbi:MAD-domain-containing protein [Calocera viscosa TUFC12733]|uniref:Spindle assembly checkpoint component MAD1 n=1 Tax=Calocera viscosa (strain TUFC12733) TaxID=1330018 RepID=A0A167HS97_CALVF|nr:MAD-domain-containing protein [Calocera viscosa TUFC12733]